MVNITYMVNIIDYIDYALLKSTLNVLKTSER